ncbi:four-helix bundle copper-binding protein [Methylocystis echinoides]|uniref:four-helix bundle copper-binding protein n=1 Tax=Methylocystis echinoides TaxID=29468 RepID=UPI0024901AA3|nr:four-helix bundle copper-binding protein [Methylocystis echinoides]
MLESYAVACCLCADECEKHAPQHEHYRVCAEACRRCEQACKEALRSLGATRHALIKWRVDGSTRYALCPPSEARGSYAK